MAREVRVAPVLKRVLDVVWVGLLAFGLVVVAAVPVLIVLDVGRLRVSLPLSFTLDEDVYAISGAVLDIRDAEISRAAGELAFSTSVPALLTAFALVGTFWTLLLMVIHQLRSVVATIADGSPFVPANARRIRFVALALLGFEAVRAMATLGISAWLGSALTAEGVSVRGAFPVRFEMLVASAAVLVIAEVFRLGTRLQEDHDLTV